VMADSSNHRIQIFDEKGAFIRVFGSRGKVMGNSGALVVLLTCREIMSWLNTATIVFRS